MKSCRTIGGSSNSRLSTTDNDGLVSPPPCRPPQPEDSLFLQLGHSKQNAPYLRHRQRDQIRWQLKVAQAFPAAPTSPTVPPVRNDPLNTARRTLIEESKGCEDHQATLQGA
jgi:hypothetical protein